MMGGWLFTGTIQAFTDFSVVLMDTIQAHVDAASGLTPAQAKEQTAARLARIPKPAAAPCADGKHVWEVHPINKSVIGIAARKHTHTTTTTTTSVNGNHQSTNSSVSQTAIGTAPIVIALSKTYCKICGHASDPKLSRADLSLAFKGVPAITDTLNALKALAPGNIAFGTLTLTD